MRDLYLEARMASYCGAFTTTILIQWPNCVLRWSIDGCAVTADLCVDTHAQITRAVSVAVSTMELNDFAGEVSWLGRRKAMAAGQLVTGG